ncbi:MAG: hypothetical protein R2712_25545 [Vicinamibacterales bacterium]
MDPRYPTGRFAYDSDVTADKRAAWVAAIGQFPTELRAALGVLSAADLDTPYREGGWTGRQVVHHVADSHINAYVRFRLALTEDAPTVKPYAEARWAELADARTEDPAVSVGILDGAPPLGMGSGVTPARGLRAHAHTPRARRHHARLAGPALRLARPPPPRPPGPHPRVNIEGHEGHEGTKPSCSPCPPCPS